MFTALLLTAAIAIDQVGYPANASKIAIVTNHAQSFEVLRSDEVILHGRVVDSTADFSRVTTPGVYTLRAGDEHVSVNVADDPYSPLLQMTMRAYTGQRCGTAVDIGSGYAHPACHLDSPVKGGWHDAGDYGRYVVNSGISTGTLLWACELFGVDMLDEIRWNVDWMLGMQDRDGSVWVKETSKEFPPFIAPQDDHSPQLLIGKSSCAAGDFAAVMAIAGRAYNEPKYTTAAERAWTWLQSHPNVTFRNPRDVKTGEYGDRDCSDERMWAAAEIWRTTRDSNALAYLRSHRFVVGVPDWQHVGPLAAWSYAMATDAPDIRARTIAAADEIVQRSRTNTYRIPLRERDYVWGSNAVAANNAMLLLIANRFAPHREYVETSFEIVHYLLGRNPFSMSFVTGTGTHSVQHPHHRPSATDNIAAPWPGLLAGGPNGHRQDPVLKAMPANTPPQLMYRDDQQSYASNEVAINWNAPLVFTLAGLRANPKSRVAVFSAPRFPTVDAPEIPHDVLRRALAPFDVRYVDNLQQLGASDRVLVLPYGSAFPLDGWTALRDFINRGGDLAVLGGAPLHQPVLRDGNDWKFGVRQPTFAHEFLFGPAEEASAAGLKCDAICPKRVWEMTIRLTRTPDPPDEGGAEGHRDAVVRPIVQLVDNNGIPRACPLLEIDHFRGEYAGARWVFAPSDAKLDEVTIRDIVKRAAEGAHDLDARPVNASVDADETPQIRIRGAESGTLIVRDDTGNELERTSFHGATAALGRRSKPGLYHVEVNANGLTSTTGFWVRDNDLLMRGPHMTVTRDWMRRDGKVFPIVGTTYMASDVHRQFLFDPNPQVWDRDFAAMQRIGVNFVRTGLWTQWARASGEPFLRALDAYVQTAAKHDIVVCFTFFAFQPLWYGGTNPFLDPKSIEGQTKFITTIAQRYRGVGWIQYDLINEPSYSPANRLWSNTPIRDPWEKRAWLDWVRAHHGNDETTLRNLWQDASDNVLDLPRDDELYYTQTREERHPFKTLDFVLFSNDVVASWAKKLYDAIRSVAPDALITLGQDEGGTGTRPSQQLHAQSVDYTSVHPWWQNDVVLSTALFSKVPEKPLLVQETGLMRLEDVNGFPWRTPQRAADLLDRKFAYAFAARATGAVEWAWNINPYMPIDNESTIGLFRPDGTAKPEFDVVAKFASFFRDTAPSLDDFAPDPVVVVIPQSRLFMNRPGGTDGARRLIRVLAERFGVVPTAISDLRLTAERLRDAKLVIVPSAEFLSDEAAKALAGKRVLFTGAITTKDARPVQFHEGAATFDRDLSEGLLRANSGDEWHEPLPLEFAREDEPLVALLDRALTAAGVAFARFEKGVAIRVLEAPRATLIIAVNESADDAVRRVNGIDVHVPAGRSTLMLVKRDGEQASRPATDD